MNIDVSKIVNDKIKELEDSGAVKKKIEESLEKTILSAFSDALESYSLKRDIKEQIEKEVSTVASDIGFSAYNGFIAEKVKQLTQEALKEDVRQKIQKTFDDLFITKHDGIKLSEIFQKYREWVCEETDEEEKYERREFTCSLDEEESGSFTHYEIVFADHELSGRYDNPNIKFRLCRYREDETDYITSLELNGGRIDESLKLGSMNEFECFMANLYYNKTRIILDVEDVDEDNYFDINI